MSGDPERLLSVSSGADPLERELLDSVRRVGPPSGAKDEAWRGIAAQIAVVSAVAAAAGSTAAASKAASGVGSWAVAAKVAVVALGGSLALGGGYLALRAPDASPSVVPGPVVAPPKAQVRPVPEAELPQEPLAPLEAPHAEEAPSRKLEPRRLDLLKAESALLMQARAELRAGNPAAAQSALEKLQTQFPQGMLSQEREVLAIEVLHARGNVDGARRRAKAFIKAYPKSPHSQKLSRFVE
ncbi:MAG: hypothetical protein K0R38_3737 [Polyangiaceae bacterium]|jgi:hypothetical protein|nr:hypothetical protein [Polyangiaceae bacterium]